MVESPVDPLERGRLWVVLMTVAIDVVGDFATHIRAAPRGKWRSLSEPQAGWRSFFASRSHPSSPIG